MTQIKNIIIDPGHGGLDNDGVYHTKGKMFEFPSGEIAYEGVINRNIARQLWAKLNYLGYNVSYTVDPSNYLDISLDERVRMSNKFNPNETLYISVHNNAAPKPGTARGFEIFTSKGKTKSDDLAESIFKQVEILYDELGIPMRSDLSDGDHDKEAQFYVLINTRMPAVLLECLFFDNYEDFKLLQDPLFISKLTSRISQGISNYIQSQDN